MCDAPMDINTAESPHNVRNNNNNTKRSRINIRDSLTQLSSPNTILRQTRSNSVKVCPSCTFLNVGQVTECEICSTSLIKSSDSNEKHYKKELNDNTKEKSTEIPESKFNLVYDYVQSNLDKYVTKVTLGNNKRGFKSNFDNHVLSTQNLIATYIAKNNFEDVIDDIKTSDTKKATSRITRSTSVSSVEDSDRKLALLIALDEYEDQSKQTTSEQTQRSSSRSKRVTSVDIVPKTKDSVEEEENEVLDESLKEIRLQKLLKRMDKIVTNIHKMMKSVVPMLNSVKINDDDDKNDEGDDNSEELDFEKTNSEFWSKHVENMNSSSSHSKTRFIDSGLLRDYQVGGVEWLLSLHAHGLNGILADEMGLGKTLQVLAFIYSLYEKNRIWGPHLIVMPLSVISSWENDVEKFFPGEISVYTHYGLKGDRQVNFKTWKDNLQLFKKKNAKRNSKRSSQNQFGMKIQIVLTSYDMIIKDSSLFQQLNLNKASINWQYVVVSSN